MLPPLLRLRGATGIDGEMREILQDKEGHCSHVLDVGGAGWEGGQGCQLNMKSIIIIIECGFMSYFLLHFFINNFNVFIIIIFSNSLSLEI